MTRSIRDLYRIERLEPRILLSADPVLAAAPVALVTDHQAAVVESVELTGLEAIRDATRVADLEQTRIPDGSDDLVLDGASLHSSLQVVDAGPLPVGMAAPHESILIDAATAEALSSEDGGGEVTIGSDDSSAEITIGDAGPVVFSDSLVLRTPQPGGEIFLDAELTVGGSLTIFGSGNTTTISMDQTSATTILINDSIIVDGAITLTAGTGGSAGDVTLGTFGFGHTLNAAATGTNTLAIDAQNGGDVRFNTEIGNTAPLDGLTILSAADVAFQQDVVIDGDLLINATGNVTFAGDVTLNEGGSLTILGASSVSFDSLNSSIVLNGLSGGSPGDIVIETDSLSLPTQTAPIEGAGTITLRPTDVGRAINIASPPADFGAVLSISLQELDQISTNFASIIVGHDDGSGNADASAGAVRIGSATAAQQTFRHDLTVYGGSIVVEDFTGLPNQVLNTNSDLNLIAVGDITISNTVDADGSDIFLESATGLVRQLQSAVDAEEEERLVADDLTVNAVTGIDLAFVDVDTLTVVNSGATGAIDVGVVSESGAVQVDRAEQSNGAGTGAIELTTENGTITLAGAGSGVVSAGSGAITLAATGGGLEIDAVVTAATGAVDLDATGLVSVDAVVSTGAAQNVSITSSAAALEQNADVTSLGGVVTLEADTNIVMDPLVRASSGVAGGIVLTAGGSVQLALLETGGDVAITATSGSVTSVLGAGVLNVDAATGELVIDAATGIGTGAAAIETRVASLDANNVTSGGIFVTDEDALQIVDDGVATSGTGGAVVLRVETGDLTISDDVTSSADAGDVLLVSNVGAVIISGTVRSDDGSVSIDAATDVTLGTSALVSVLGLTTPAETLDVIAGGSVLLSAGAMLNTNGTNNGNQRIVAGADVQLGAITAGTGSVSVEAGGAITRAAGPTSTNVIAGALRLDAATGIGAAGAALELAVTSLAAETTAGSVFLSEADAVTVNDAAAVTVTRVAADGTTTTVGAGDATVSGVTTGTDGALVLQAGTAMAGTLRVVSAVTASGAGNVLLESAGGFELAVALDAGTGDLTIDAAGAASLEAGADIDVAGAATVDLSAASLAMADGATITAVSGNVRLAATGTVTIGSVSTGGDAAVSGSAVTDSGTGGNTVVDLVADELAITSGGAIGSSGTAIASTVTRLSASSGTDGTFLAETDTLVIGATAAVNVNRVGADGTSTLTSDGAVQNDVVSGGDVVVSVALGNLTTEATGQVTSAAGADGNVLLQAAGDVTLGAIVTTDSGHVSVAAGAALQQDADLSSTFAGGTVEVRAGTTITMGAATVTSTNDGDVRYEAGTDLALASITAGAGSVSLTSGADGALTGSITDANAAADNVTAAGLLMVSDAGIGTGGDPIETTVTTLAASAAGGGMFLAETDAVIVDTVDVTVQRVGADATVSAQMDTGEDLATTADGAIVLDAGGAITVSAGTAMSGGVSAAGTGNVLLDAAGDLTLNAGLDAGSGSASLLSTGTFVQAAAGDVVTTGAGTIDVVATTAVTMDADATITADANIRVETTGTLTVGLISTTAGDLSLVTGDVVDADGTAGNGTADLVGGTLKINSTGAVGTSGTAITTTVTTLSGLVAGGGVFLRETDGLTIGQTGIFAANRVDSLGAAAAIPGTTDALQDDLDSAGALIVTVVSGDLVTLATGAASATGNLLLTSEAGAVTLGADVASTSGDVSVSAATSVAQDANVTATGLNETVEVRAGTTITMGAATITSTNDGDVRYEAGTDLALASITVGAGSVSLTSGADGALTGSITDANAAADNVMAAGLLMVSDAGIGTGGDPIETTVTTLAASAAGGGMFLAETDAVIVDTVDVTVQRVGADATVSAQMDTGEDLATTADGAIVLDAGGAITVSAGTAMSGGVSAAGTGNVLLDAAGDLTLNAGLDAGSGSASLLSTGTFVQAAAGDVVTTGAGTIDVVATTAVTMDADATITADANIRVETTGTLTVGLISTTAGDLSLVTGDVVDADGTAGNGTADLVGGTLKINSTGAVGTSGTAITTTVTTLSGLVAGGGVFLRETDGLTIGQTGIFAANRVDSLGAAAAIPGTTDALQDDLDSAGALIVTVVSGDLVTLATGAASATGNLLLTSEAGAVTLGADVASTSGDVSVSAATSVAQDANVTATGLNETVEVRAGTTITMGAATITSTNDGDVRYEAGTDLALASITVGAGSVSLTSGADGALTGSITDANAAADNVMAAGLLMVSDVGIGTGGDPIETTVTTLAASAAGGGMFLAETDAVIVDTVDVTVQRVGADATVSAQMDTLEDLTTTADGAIVLDAVTDITVNAGTAMSGGVSAAGAGDVRLQSGATLTLDAAVDGGTGNVSLLATTELVQNADGDVTTTGMGTVDADSATITMADGAVTSAEANIRYDATAGVFTIGQLTTTADVSIVAGSVLDAEDGADANVDIVGVQLKLDVDGAIGEGDDHIRSTVTRLSGDSDAAGVYLIESDGLIVGETSAITVARVESDGTTGTNDPVDAAQSNLASGGHLVLVVEAGSLVTEATGAIAADGAGMGSVLLRTDAADGDITFGADVTSGVGSISIDAGRSLFQNANVGTSGAGTDVEIVATGVVTMADGTTTTTAGGNVRVEVNAGMTPTAANDLTLGGIDAGAGSVSLVAGNVIDGGDGDVDVTAAELRLFASQGAGTDGAAVAALDTDLGTLSANVGADGLYLSDLGDVTIDRIGDITVDRVQLDGSLTTRVDLAQEDLVSALDGDLVVEAEAITVLQGLTTQGVASGTTGDVRLQARTTDVDVQALIGGVTGHVTIVAARDVLLAGLADVISNIAATTIHVNAGRDVTMTDGASIRSAGDGDVRLSAGEDIGLALVDVGTGAVALEAGTGSITDTQTPVGDANVVAAELIMVAGTGIGAGANAIETTIDTLALDAGTGGAFVRDTGVLSVGAVSVTVETVDAAGTTPGADQVTTADADAETTADGDLVITAVGQLTLTDGDTDGVSVSAAGDGDVRLASTTNGIEVQADVDGGAGHVTLRAQTDLQHDADIVTTTDTIELRSVTGSVLMDAAATVTSGADDIRVLAATDIEVGTIMTATEVSLIATAGSITESGDDAGDEISAAGLRMVAGTGIGLSTNTLETGVDLITARAQAGGLFVLEADAVTVGDVQVVIEQVQADASTMTITDLTQSDVATTAGDGDIVLQTTAGDLTLTDGTAAGDATAVSANGSGDVLLATLGVDTDVLADAAILSTSGHITIAGARDVQFRTMEADVTSGAAGTVEITAGSGSIVQIDGSVIDGTAGDVRLQAEVNVSLAAATTSTDVSVIATTGSILDNGDAAPEISAAGARLVAGTGIGLSTNALDTTVATLTARAGAGGVFVLEADDLAIDDVDVTITRVAADASTSIQTDALQSDVVTTAAGDIVIETTAGTLTLNDGTASADGNALVADTTGDVRLAALGALTDLVLNADVRSGDGHLTLAAARNVQLSTDADVFTAAGTIEATAGADVTMDASATLASTSDDVRVEAGANIAVGTITTATEVSLIATTGSITESGDDAGNEISAAGLRMVAGTGIGLSTNALETGVDLITARAQAGGLFVLEADAVTVGDVQVVIEQVQADASAMTVTDLTQSDVATTAGDGDIVLQTTAGDLTLTDGTAADDATAVSANGSGDVLLATLGVDTDVLADAAILSTSGHITIAGARDVQFRTMEADVTSGAAGTVEITAGSGSIVQIDGSVIDGTAGDVRLQAEVNVSLAAATTSTDVSVIATTGSILDNGDAAPEISAAGARLVAGTGIGLSTNALDTAVDTLTARAGAGGVFVLEAGALAIDDVDVTITRVAADAGISAVTDATQSDVVTTAAGDIVIETTAGTLTLNDGTASADGNAIVADTTGNVRVAALGALTDLVLNADVRSGDGHLTLAAARNVQLSTDVDVFTAAGTIEATAGADVTMDASATLASTSDDVRVEAGANIAVGTITTATEVSLIATTGSITESGDDAGDEISAAGLRLVAGTGIGLSTNALETGVDLITARAQAGGIFVLEADAVTVGDVQVVIEQVQADASTMTITDLTQSDVATTAGDGDIVLQTTAGDLVLTDGTAADDATAVTANGSGDVLLATLGADTDVLADAAILSTSGHITIAGARDVQFRTMEGDVTSGAAGTVEATAGSGSIVQIDGSVIDGTAGDVRLQAEVNVSLAAVTTSTDVSVIATTGSILDNGDAAPEISAAGARLVAGTGIGLSTNALDTAVDTLTARAGAGGVFVLEADALAIDDVDVTITRVAADAGISAVTDATQSDVVTTAAGGIVIETTAGTLTLNDGTASADGNAIVADTTGDVRLAALGAATDLTLNADVRSGSASITLSAARDQSLAAAADVVTTGAGTIDLEAVSGSLTQTDGSTISADADVRLAAAADVTVAAVATAANASFVTGGSILDGGVLAIDVVATGLRIEAGSAAGTGADALDATVSTLTATVGSGGLFLLESDGLATGDVGATVQRVAADGSTADLTDATRSDLVSSADGALVLTTSAGDLVLADGTATNGDTAVSAAGAGAVRLDALAGRVLVEADVLSATGSLTLTAGTDVTQAMGTTVASGGAGTIDVQSLGAGFVQAAGASLDGGDGDVRILSNGALVLDAVTTTADVGLIATGAGVSGNAGATHVTAGGLSVASDATIDLSLSVGTFAATAPQAITVTEANGLVVGDVDVTVQRVAADATTSAVTDPTRSDVVTTANDAAIALTVSTGDLALTDGTGSADGFAVVADGAGTVNLVSTAGGITASALIASTTGDIDLVAVDDVLFSGTGGIAAATTETISVTSSAGAIRQDATSLITNTVGDVALTAETNVVLGRVVTPADVAVTTTTGFTSGEAAAAPVNVDAAILTLTAPWQTTAGPVGLGDDVIFIEGLPTTFDVDRLVFEGADSIIFGGIGAADANLGADTGLEIRIPNATFLTETTAQFLVFDILETLTLGGTLIATGPTGVVFAPGNDFEVALIDDTGDAAIVVADVVDLEDLARIGLPNEPLILQPVLGGTAITLGNQATAGLDLDSEDLSKLAVPLVVIGSETGTHAIEVRTTDGSAVTLTQPVRLQAPGAGGTISLNGTITGVDLTVEGPGDGTTLTSTQVSTSNDLTIDDGVTVSGTSSLTAGTDGSGSVRITGPIDGTGAADDVLVVAAQGGNVEITGVIGGTTPLAGLVVTDAVNVTFDQPVTIDGDFVVDATGVVRFTQPVTLVGDANLLLAGASEVIFEAGVVLGGGQFLVENVPTVTFANDIAGGIGGSLSVSGTERLVGEAAGSGLTLEVSGDSLVFASSPTGGAIDLGDVSVTLTSTDSAVFVDAVLATGTEALSIVGQGVDVTLSADVDSAAGAIDLRAGNLTMDLGTTVTSAAGSANLRVEETLSVARVEAPTVVLQSTGGAGGIVSANGADVVNVVAADLTIRGLGPTFDVTAVPILIDADEVSVAVPSGIVLQDTTGDGRIEFVALAQGSLFRQAISVDRAVDRDTDIVDPDGELFAEGGGFGGSGITIRPRLSELASATGASTESEALAIGSLFGLPSVTAGYDNVSAQITMSSDPGALDDSWLLGDPAQQPTSAGLVDGVEPAFDYWVETLSL